MADSWLSIDPGELRHTVALQAPTPIMGAGGADVAFSPWKTTRGRWAATSARDAIASGQDTPQVEGTLRIRYRAGVQAGMRAVVNGNTYQILAVVNVGERNILLDLTVLALGPA